ncbi:MAG: hypothetical protein A2176_11310 [Spirochaetes bacterium RBG_13_51_14]|nr:MAG: hypothetical protein A2176_11310 [Spirochaetes bacterium RBG_13_51_14]
MNTKTTTVIRIFISLFTEEYMNLLKSIAAICVMTILAFGAGCANSGDQKPYFQNNTGSTDPNGVPDPFSDMPNFGDPTFVEDVVAIIGEAFNPGTFNLDQDAPEYQTFVDNIQTMVDSSDPLNVRDEAREVLNLVPDLADNYTTGHGAYGLMAALANIMGYVLYQDDLDNTSGDYINDLYDFVNSMIDADLDMKTDVLTLMHKSLGFFDARYVQTGQIQTIMTDLNSFLSDASGQTFVSLMFNMQEGLGKILMRANSNIIHDDPSDSPDGGNEDTGLGNAVSGVDYLMTGINDMISANNAYDGPAARQNLYDLLRETGMLIRSLKGAGPTYYPVLKNLLKNIEDYYTVQGSVYQPSAEYHNASNPYVNAEIRNTVKEIWPTLAKLFIRERVHPDYSMISTGYSRSPIEWLTRALHDLKKAGMDYSDTTNYALEPSLKNLVKYNAYGQDRATAGYKVSYLDHLLFTLGAAYNFGYLTRNSCSGEPYNNLDRGHGASTKGVLTISDTMYSLESRSKSTLGIPVGSSYDLALDIRLQQGSRIWRAYSNFTIAGRNGHQFYVGKDLPALCLLPSGCAGDVGIPNGGDRALTPTDDDTSGNDYKTYFPYAADGNGMGNTAIWMMSLAARDCWDGGGPYYSTQGAYQTNNNSNGLLPDWSGKTGTDNYRVYFKPNGEVYAYVDKDATPWTYYYPATGNDVVDTKIPGGDIPAPNGQRFNRYRDKLYSDWYLVQEGQNSNSYVAPPMNGHGTGDGLIENSNPTDHRSFHLTTSSGNQPHYFRVFEKLQEARQADNVKRECTTHEIAMYRNIQWLMLEKKFLFVIPMNIDKLVTVCQVNSGAFLVLETNGLLGQVNMKKSGPDSNNGYWALQGGLGNLNQSDGVTSNAPDYRDSSYRGDARLVIWAVYQNLVIDEMSPEVMWNDILGNASNSSGYVLPDIIGKNIYPAVNMAFPTQDNTGSNFQNTIASDSSIIGDPANTHWQNRSKIFPILISLLGTLLDGSYYQTGSGADYNYSATATHKYPLADLFEGLMIPLSKPLMRYYTDAESFTGGSSSTGRWVPRLEAEPSINGYTRFDYLQPSISGGGVDYRPRSALRTLPSFLADQTTSTYYNGIIPALVDDIHPENNNLLVTKLVALLQRMGNYDDPSSPYRDVADGGSGILENMSKGLEQIITSIQVDRGEVYTPTNRSWLYSNRFDQLLNSSRYGWMFWDLNNRRSGTPISVDLTVALNELIGDNTRGLSKFIDDHDPGGWANYDRLLDALGELMGDQASQYYLLGDESTHGTLIHIINNLLTGTSMSSTDRQALRHTLGILMTRYQTGAWTTNTELRDILNHYLPEVLTTFNTHYGDFVVVLEALLDYDHDGTVNPEILDYLTDMLIPGDLAEEVIPQMYELLSRDAMWDSAYYSTDYPNHATLKELAVICEELAAAITP